MLRNQKWMYLCYVKQKQQAMTQVTNIWGAKIEVGMKVMAQTVKFGNVVKGCKGQVTEIKSDKDGKYLARVKKKIGGTYWYSVDNMFELNA